MAMSAMGPTTKKVSMAGRKLLKRLGQWAEKNFSTYFMAQTDRMTGRA